MKPSDVKLWIDPELLQDIEFYKPYLEDALTILHNSVWYPEVISRVDAIGDSNYAILRYGAITNVDPTRFRLKGGRMHYIFINDSEFENAMNNLHPESKYEWRWKYSENNPGYEVTSKGDRRFSPMCMRLSDGTSIEDFYQKNIKGGVGKGKPCKDMETALMKLNCLMKDYLFLHNGLLYELAYIGRHMPFTDMFDKDGGQNRTYAMILNEYYNLR